MKNVHLFLKRCLDLIGGLAGLLLLSPLFLILIVLIRCTSKGPAFFRQDRLGKKGKVFQIYKFRTMVENAEYLGDGLTVKNETDTRITRIGRFLRATSLDELPQLINVVNGTMSLVGPRPPVTYAPYKGYQSYPTFAKQRFNMRPGMTGLTQVTVRNSVTWDERMQVDNRYVEKFSIWLDIKILFKTVGCIIKPQRIYLTEKKG